MKISNLGIANARAPRIQIALSWVALVIAAVLSIAIGLLAALLFISGHALFGDLVGVLTFALMAISEAIFDRKYRALRSALGKPLPPLKPCVRVEPSNDR
jgi:ABC-type polysaccharide/polyol phosphate export permease